MRWSLTGDARGRPNPIVSAKVETFVGISIFPDKKALTFGLKTAANWVGLVQSAPKRRETNPVFGLISRVLAPHPPQCPLTASQSGFLRPNIAIQARARSARADAPLGSRTRRPPHPQHLSRRERGEEATPAQCPIPNPSSRRSARRTTPCRCRGSRTCARRRRADLPRVRNPIGAR